MAAVAVAGLLLPGALEAQTGKISGLVTDATTGEPVEGVAVRVAGTGFGSMTQANGRYFIIGVPPGTYVVSARRIGYQAVEVANVQVRIDVTREVNFSLPAASSQLTAVRIQAEQVPLVEQGITGSAQAVPVEIIEALPVTNVAGVLALQSGFLEVPQNTDIVSFSESRRNPLSPIRIRGGRAGETLTLIDGIPVNNVVFGGRAFDLTTSAVQQLDYQKGGFEPQYGNALSGIINIATREGGVRYAGSLEYQSTGLAGNLGSTPDDLAGYDLFRGFVSGPVPGSANKLRFVLAGQQESGADAVYEFDRDVYDFDNPPTSIAAPEQLDLFPGWRALGYNQARDVFAKLTFVPTATSKLNLTVVDYERQRQSFDYDFLLVGFDPLSSPTVNTIGDTLGLNTFRNYRDVVQGSIRADRQLYVASYSQRFGRSNLTVRGARFDQRRQTCNFFQGVCLAQRFADVNFNDRFVAPGITPFHPAAGTDEFFGGEEVSTNIFRADLESQLTDHHNLQGGVSWQQHDIVFDEFRNQGTNDIFIVPGKYRAKPYELAAYMQDRIEYDFLTVKLGARFDYGQAKGSGFANPLDPTNGTTAAGVCSGTLPQFGATQQFERTIRVDVGGTPVDSTYTGVGACGRFSDLMDSARVVAQQDDFRKADTRTAFSPRIGVSFPLTERSSLFFNAGRYTQNPLYNNVYQNSGVGTVAGDEDGVCAETAVKPGTTECHPTLAADAYTPPFLGNPNLLLEQSTAYEVGYAAEVGRMYAINVTLFTKDQTGLTGIRRSQATQDIAATYNGRSLPVYDALVNQDYGTSRGFEVQFRRRITNFWGFDVNYSFSKATSNAAPPDRQQQSQQEGDPTQLREIRSEIDQPHVFNTSLFFRVDDRAPEFRFGNLLRRSSLTLTQRAASGLPYTPTRSFNAIGDQNDLGDINSARGPSTYQTDLLATKDFNSAAMRYGVFLRVINLFDTENCVQVFATTGRCDAGTIDQRRARNGNSVGPTTSSTYFDRPTYFGPRRSIYTGVRVGF